MLVTNCQRRGERERFVVSLGRWCVPAAPGEVCLVRRLDLLHTTTRDGITIARNITLNIENHLYWRESIQIAKVPFDKILQ